jgi:acyl dehydratase
MTQAGDAFTLSVTPDRYLTVRYAGASGDFNPIHIDEDFARSVGLPGKILHGLWSMAQVARAHTEAFGGPESLAALSVQFRGMGVPEKEIQVNGTVTGADGELARTSAEATQDGTRIVRNATAEIRMPGA